MESRHTATDARRIVSPCRSQTTPVGDGLCKVAFVDVNVAKTTTTPRTSCRSAASSDSEDESVTSSSSGSRDDEHMPASSTATWSTYVYFYPRHDMTFTHCLLTTSRQIDADVSPCCWPSLPSQDTVSSHRHGRRPARRRDEETVPSCVASRWRRRVNAARTPFWFPVVPSYDTEVRAYFYYPRHDLSYAEVEVSRVDRQPGVDQSSLPFDTILEELTDDENSLDDLSAVLEDRKSLIDDYGDLAAQLPCRVVPDDLRSTSSSLSAYDSEELTQNTLEVLPDDTFVALNVAADKSPSVINQEIPSSDRTVMSTCRLAVKAILTPVTKLDLKSFEPVTPRQRVDSGRTRAGCHIPICVTMRRSVSDNSVVKGSQRSPVGELPLSARVIKNQEFSAAAAAVEEDRVDDVTADGDQAFCSPPAVVPLCSKRAFTCLLSQQQSVVNNAAALSRARDDAVTGQEGVAVLHFTHQFTSSAAELNQRHTIDNQMENTDRTKDDSLVDDCAEDLTWKLRAEITSPKITSAGATSLLKSPSFSTSSSEYLTPPTRRDSETTVTTTAVTARDRVTTFCDVGSRTLANAELRYAEVRTVRDGSRRDSRPVTASSTFTRLFDPASPQLTEVQTEYPSENTAANSISRRTQIHAPTSTVVDTHMRFTKSLRRPSYQRGDSYQVPVQSKGSVATSFPAITWVYDAASKLPEKTIRGTKITRSFREEHDTANPTIHTASPATEVHFPLEEKRLATASATLTRVYSVLSPTVDISVSSSAEFQYLPTLKQTRLGGCADRKHGSRVIEVGRRRSEHVVNSSDLPLRHSLDRRRMSTPTLSRTAPPAHPRRRPSIERVGPDSLLDVGGLTAYVAALTPRNQDKPRPPPQAAVNHRGYLAWRRTPPPNSYVSIWRKRIATYEAFVSRCQSTTTATGTAVRCQHRR